MLKLKRQIMTYQGWNQEKKKWKIVNLINNKI